MCIYNIQINECDSIHKLCDPVNAHCVDTIDSYSCTCHDGFETEDGGRTCINIDECSPEFDGGNKCVGPNTVCIDLVEPGHTCECSQGFDGEPYEEVGCSRCAKGYLGDGTSCKGKIWYKIIIKYVFCKVWNKKSINWHWLYAIKISLQFLLHCMYS